MKTDAPTSFLCALFPHEKKISSLPFEDRSRGKESRQNDHINAAVKGHSFGLSFSDTVNSDTEGDVDALVLFELICLEGRAPDTLVCVVGFSPDHHVGHQRHVRESGLSSVL